MKWTSGDYVVIFFVFISCLQTIHCLSCNCEMMNCRKIERQRCPGGRVKDMCACCNVCAKQEGEECGGMWNMAGSCDKGLKCNKQKKVENMMPGQCMLDPTYVARQDWSFWDSFFRRLGRK